MELCERQKEIIVLITPLLVAGFATLFGLINLGQAIITFLVFDVPMITYIYLRDKRIKKREKRLTKLNIDVFKLWMDAKKHESKFQIEISIDGNIDKELIKDAIDFLESKRKKYGKILELRTKIIGLKKDYNFIGENIRDAIINHLADAYPSLQGKEVKSVVRTRGECYFTNTIIEFVESILKPEIMKNEPINWDEIMPKPVPYRDVSPPMWCLESFGVHIQSNNVNEVDEEYYQTFMIDLISIIENELKQQYEINEKRNQHISKFKDKVHGLSIDIELNRV